VSGATYVVVMVVAIVMLRPINEAPSEFSARRAPVGQVTLGDNAERQCERRLLLPAIREVE
jgi:hypothetical protein